MDGKDCRVHKDVERVLKEFHEAGKPIGYVGVGSAGLHRPESLFALRGSQGVLGTFQLGKFCSCVLRSVSVTSQERELLGGSPVSPSLTASLFQCSFSSPDLCLLSSLRAGWSQSHTSTVPQHLPLGLHAHCVLGSFTLVCTPKLTGPCSCRGPSSWVLAGGEAGHTCHQEHDGAPPVARSEPLRLGFHGRLAPALTKVGVCPCQCAGACRVRGFGSAGWRDSLGSSAVRDAVKTTHCGIDGSTPDPL